jgi:hypothetical protein
MIRKSAIPIFALGLFLALPHTARACFCGNATVQTAFAGAEAVFIGKVVKIRTLKEASVGLSLKESGTLEVSKSGRWEKSVDKVQSVTLEVLEIFKGEKSETIELITSEYNGGGSCGVRFRRGEDFLVYAYKRKTVVASWQEPSAFDATVKENWTTVMQLSSEADKFNQRLPLLTTSICVRTERLRWAQPDIVELRLMVKDDVQKDKKN